MTIRMTEEQARKAGLLKALPKGSKKKGMGREGAVSVCVCGERFTSDAAETRHMDETGHRRFETPLEG